MAPLALAIGSLVLLFSFSQTAFSASAPYRGSGGQIEAAGIIAGAYILTAANIEHCAKNAQMKTRAMRSVREYLNKNQQSYMDVMRKLPELAFATGGSAEVQRLKRELETGLTKIESEAKSRVRSPAPSMDECTAFLDRVDSGMLDLKVNYNNELTRILQ